MTTQFLSRVEREPRGESYPNVGPGGYFLPGGISRSAPGFAPFSTTSRRKAPGEEGVSMGLDSPSPGTYNVSEDLTKKTGVSSVFKSNAKRFKDLSRNPEPGPGDYILQSSFGKTVRTFSQPSSNPLALVASKRLECPPSIPAKSQANGYEILPDGKVQPQGPLIPGYSGRPGDTVGPGDYDPRIDIKFKHAPGANFSKGADRNAIDKILTKVSSAPGPGYYDTPSDFDLLLNGYGANEMDFLVHLHNAKRKQTSAFESKTSRDALMKEIERKKNIPGPGQYHLPSAIKVETKPPNLQFFTSSDERFKDNHSKSMRITVAPGEYNPITSEFDQMRLKILKQKKMASRSDWAQNVAFTSTETRFKAEAFDNDVPPSTSYYPKIGIADQAKKPNPRGGAFDSTEERFRQPKPPSAYESKEKIVERELNKELAQFLNRPNNQDEHVRDSRSSPTKPKFTSSFAPTPDNRLRPVKTPPGPPPGAYDTQPKWLTGAPVMAPSMVVSKKRHDPQPGPGQYTVDRGMGGSKRNPKNIMISTTTRDEKVIVNAPPPGRYEIGTTLLRPSHNILLSDKYH